MTARASLASRRHAAEQRIILLVGAPIAALLVWALYVVMFTGGR